ncbi:MAG: hypothetical protein CL606_08295 [Anaerolineaceae bacterium]|nr:hypothetical protein [Anaerolineaceae bacterium]|tara:strand:- start:13619 stop:14563 length:945 start_codon:yes stop_codon:yes gene_type:complete
MSASQEFDLVALGCTTLELLSWVDRYPGASDGIHTDKQLWTGGGMSGNLAHAVAQLGGQVALLAATGSDSIGDRMIDQLRVAGVNVEYLLRRDNTLSQLTVLMVTSDLKRAGLVITLPADLQIKSSEIPDDLLKSARVFFTDMDPANTAIDVSGRAKALGIPVAYDLQMAPERINIPEHARNINKMLDLSDYLFADEENFLMWGNYSDLSTAISEVLHKHPEMTLLITQGSDGSVVATQKQTIEINAFPIDVVDSIGAGDAYHATFLYTHIALGWSVKKACIYGSAAASLSCTKAGARDGLPTLEEIDYFVNRS